MRVMYAAVTAQFAVVVLRHFVMRMSVQDHFAVPVASWRRENTCLDELSCGLTRIFFHLCLLIMDHMYPAHLLNSTRLKFMA